MLESETSTGQHFQNVPTRQPQQNPSWAGASQVAALQLDLPSPLDRSPEVRRDVLRPKDIGSSDGNCIGVLSLLVLDLDDFQAVKLQFSATQQVRGACCQRPFTVF